MNTHTHTTTPVFRNKAESLKQVLTDAEKHSKHSLVLRNSTLHTDHHSSSFLQDTFMSVVDSSAGMCVCV